MVSYFIICIFNNLNYKVSLFTLPKLKIYMELISNKEFQTKAKLKTTRVWQLVRGYKQYLHSKNGKRKIRFQKPMFTENIDYKFVSGKIFFNKNSELVKKRLDKSS